MPELTLFILESIGTQELVLIGIIALIVFGPRKLPQMAKKFGGILTELRKVSSDFRTTWEKEASLGDDLLNIDSSEETPSIGPGTIPQESDPTDKADSPDDQPAPAIREVDPEEFKSLARKTPEETKDVEPAEDASSDPTDTPAGKLCHLRDRWMHCCLS